MGAQGLRALSAGAQGLSDDAMGRKRLAQAPWRRGLHLLDASGANATVPWPWPERARLRTP